MKETKVDDFTVKSNTTDVLLFDKLKYLTSNEAAILLRTSAGQIRNLVWGGRLKAYHYGNRLRFLRADVEKLMKPSF